jgi:hypothetical protein
MPVLYRETREARAQLDADARLIAAAPELYEALLCVSDSIDHAVNCRARYGGECGCSQRALGEQIAAALAKARGEQ